MLTKMKKKEKMKQLMSINGVFHILYVYFMEYFKADLKNYYCYHLIDVAKNEGLVEIPRECKDVRIEAKPKRIRKAKAKLALQKNAHN